MKALVTGSGGLIGSECVRLLAAEGWDVVGLDNDMRRQFFGPAGTSRPVVDDLVRRLPSYRHVDLVMVRATTDPGDLERPDLDLSNPTAIEHDGRAWLAKTWARTDVREALHTASPALAGRIDELLDDATGSATIGFLKSKSK